MPSVRTTPGFCQATSRPARPYPPDPIPLFLPGGSLNLFAAAPGTGKTALLASVLQALRTGGPVFGHAIGEVAGLGWITADRSWEKDTKHWFGLVGYPDIPHYSIPDDPTFNPSRLRNKEHRLAILTECFGKLTLPPHSLVVIDPMALFLGGDLNRYGDVAVACLEVRNLLLSRQWTAIGPVHAAKLKADKGDRYLRLQDRILGSAALLGYSDTQMYLASPEETTKPYFTFLWHPHLAPAEEVHLVQNAQGLFVPYEAGKTAPSVALIDLVYGLLPEDGTPIDTETLLIRATEIPISRATLFRHLSTLLQEDRIAKAAQGSYKRKLIQ